MLNSKRLFIYCAGGSGREVLKQARFMNRKSENWESIVFIDDFFQGESLNGIPVWTFDAYLRQALPQQDEFLIANGEPTFRKKLAQLLTAHGCRQATLVHPSIYLDDYDVVGAGAILTAGTILAGNNTIGRCTYVNLACTLSHDTTLGDFVTVSPGSTLCGNVTIGDLTYIGTGTVVREGIKIGKNCIIGMGSLVTQAIPDGMVAYGSPCKVVRPNTKGTVFQ